MAINNRFNHYKPKESLESKYKINEQIQAQNLRVVTEDGEQLGILSREEALSYAKEHELDLIEIAAQADPPVARVQSWSKYKFELLKKEKLAQKKNKSKEIKEMWFAPLIGKNDLEHKVNRVKEFLEDKHSVKLVIKMRGRVSNDIAIELMGKILEGIKEVSTVDGQPKREGRQIIALVRPIKAKQLIK